MDKKENERHYKMVRKLRLVKLALSKRGWYYDRDIVVRDLRVVAN